MKQQLNMFKSVFALAAILGLISSNQFAYSKSHTVSHKRASTASQPHVTSQAKTTAQTPQAAQTYNQVQAQYNYYNAMDNYLHGMEQYHSQYGRYVQNYPMARYFPQGGGSPTPSETEAAQRQQTQWRRQEDARTAMHALIEHYGCEYFDNSEELTKRAVRYADLLRYGQTHTHTNPDTNIGQYP